MGHLYFFAALRKGDSENGSAMRWGVQNAVKMTGGNRNETYRSRDANGERPSAGRRREGGYFQQPAAEADDRAADPGAVSSDAGGAGGYVYRELCGGSGGVGRIPGQFLQYHISLPVYRPGLRRCGDRQPIHRQREKRGRFPGGQPASDDLGGAFRRHNAGRACAEPEHDRVPLREGGAGCEVGLHHLSADLRLFLSGAGCVQCRGGAVQKHWQNQNHHEHLRRGQCHQCCRKPDRRLCFESGRCGCGVPFPDFQSLFRRGDHGAVLS